MEMQNQKKYKNRGMRAVFRLLFGRTMVTMLLLVFQVVLLVAGFNWLNGYYEVFVTVFTVIAGVITIYIINCNENPAFKLAWMLPVCLFPVFGAALFIFVQVNPGNRGLRKKLNRRIEETKEFCITESRILRKIKLENSPIRGLSRYIREINGYPTYDQTEITYFSSGEEKYEDLLIELKNAKKFIFMEYFIIDQGIVWDTILGILVEKAKQGVEVRIMYDGMCSLIKLPYNYPKELRKKGLKAKMFSPIKPLLSTHQNNRDHRKILVIDGNIAYNGGINLADEYINERKLYGHWKDVAVKLNGDAVRSFTIMFLQMWNVDESGKEEYARYLVNERNHRITHEKGYVIPYCDAPTNREDVAETVFLDLLYRSEKYVHIMTPYLVIDNELQVALSTAAKRGVEVIIILPHIPDKKYAFYIARTYYPQLLEAGVKIYEYSPGFMHAKVFVSDHEKAVVGSINLDFRSLYEHFECATYIYRNRVIAEIEIDFQNTLRKSKEITLKEYKQFSFLTRGIGRILRIFAPLM